MKKHCKNCNEEFDSQNDRQIYCSDSCKTQAYNKRKEADAENNDKMTISVTLKKEELESLDATANQLGIELNAYVKTKVMFDDNSQVEINRLEGVIDEMEVEINNLKLMLSLKDKSAKEKGEVYFMDNEQRACLIQCCGYLKSIKQIPKETTLAEFIRYCVINYLIELRDWHVPIEERNNHKSLRDTSLAQYAGLKKMFVCEVFEKDFLN